MPELLTCCSSFRSDSLALFRCFAHCPVGGASLCQESSELLLTRDFPYNIHVKTTNRLESLHYFNVSTRRKITIARSHVNSHMVFEIPNLHYAIAAYSPSNKNKRNKVHFHSVTVTQSIFQHFNGHPFCII